MDEIREILKQLQEKKLSIEESEKLLRANLIEQVGDLAKLDIFRKTRIGVPEVIYAQNKDSQMLKEIINSLLEKKKFAIITRYTKEQKEIILKNIERTDNFDIEINDLGKIIIIKEKSFNLTRKKWIV